MYIIRYSYYYMLEGISRRKAPPPVTEWQTYRSLWWMHHWFCSKPMKITLPHQIPWLYHEKWRIFSTPFYLLMGLSQCRTAPLPWRTLSTKRLAAPSNTQTGRHFDLLSSTVLFKSLIRLWWLIEVRVIEMCTATCGWGSGWKPIQENTGKQKNWRFE